MSSEVVEVGRGVTEVAVGNLVHTGTPHQEETVLDLAASLQATYPLVVLPTDERLERGVFLSLAAVALQAVHDAEIKLGDAVSVHGLGAIGLLAVQMCRLEGIQNVIGIDPEPHRRDLAARFGATHVLDAADDKLGLTVRDRNGGHGVDVAIEVSGSDRGLQGALSAAGLGGTVVAAGFYQGGAAHLRLGEEFHHNRLSLIASVGSWGAPDRHAPLWNRRRVLDTAARLLFTDRVAVDGLLDRTFPFERRRLRPTGGWTSTRTTRSRSHWPTEPGRRDRTGRRARRRRPGRLRHLRCRPARTADRCGAAAAAARRGVRAARAGAP